MDRRLVAFVAVPVALALAASARAQTQSPPVPPLAVKLAVCEHGPAVADRTAVFSASMPHVDGAARMAMRFDLYEADADGAFHRLSVPGFGRYERSDLNVAGFAYDKRVESLDAPASYRVKVQFRWLDGGGAIVRRAQRTSAVCRQPDPRPDVLVTRLTVGIPDLTGTAIYTALVRNTGRTATPAPFAVALRSAGARIGEQTLASLDVDGTTTVIFRARACTRGTVISAVADAEGTVDETDESDNSLRVTCPG